MPVELLRDTQMERLRATLRNAADNVPFYRRRLDEAGVAPDDVTCHDDACAPAVHHQGRPARPLPVRHVRRAPRAHRARARLVGHDRQSDHRGLHGRRHRPVGRPHRPHAGRRRHAARRHAAERLRLRPVHRRPRPALRLRASRRHHPADLAAATPTASSSSCATSASRRCRARPRMPSIWPKRPATAACGRPTCPSGSAFTAPSPGPTRCAARSKTGLGVDALDIYGLSEMGGPGVAFECRCKGGMHVNEDHYLVEIVDPEYARAGARGHGRRARLHHPEPGGPAADPLPHARPLQPRRRALRVRPHLRPHEQAGRAHRRHADHPRRQRLPEPDRGSPHDDPADRAPLPDPGRPQGPPRHGRGLDRGRRGRLRRDHGLSSRSSSAPCRPASTACSASRCR